MRKIAIIGCGAIGAGVLELLKDEPGLSIGWVVLHEDAHGHADAQTAIHRFAPNAKVVPSLAADDRPDLLVECAGHSAIEEHLIPALQRGIPCMLASVGALSAPGLAARVEQAAKQGGTQVQLIAGAIGGIDALSAARIGGLDEVTYSGRKPPKAWKGTPAEQDCDLDNLQNAQCIFDGTAEQAAQLYPKNANVAATLSLAGIGLQRTRVRLFADPGVSENVHHIEARGAFGSFEMTLRGKPLAANPKTSALTVYSVVRAITNRGAAMAI